ncbi:hypothetical protein BC940DRAFT_57747 [Gongronella butleri]|nr:hypothetical protein BC940DRAFT_57747 [Gongronella butleri]
MDIWQKLSKSMFGQPDHVYGGYVPRCDVGDAVKSETPPLVKIEDDITISALSLAPTLDEQSFIPLQDTGVPYQRDQSRRSRSNSPDGRPTGRPNLHFDSKLRSFSPTRSHLPDPRPSFRSRSRSRSRSPHGSDAAYKARSYPKYRPPPSSGKKRRRAMQSEWSKIRAFKRRHSALPSDAQCAVCRTNKHLGPSERVAHRLWIDALPVNMTMDELTKIFRDIGPLKDLRIRSRLTPRKGGDYAIVEFTREIDMMRAIQMLSDYSARHNIYLNIKWADKNTNCAVTSKSIPVCMPVISEETYPTEPPTQDPTACRLFLTNLPPSYKPDMLRKDLGTWEPYVDIGEMQNGHKSIDGIRYDSVHLKCVDHETAIKVHALLHKKQFGRRKAQVRWVAHEKDARPTNTRAPMTSRLFSLAAAHLPPSTAANEPSIAPRPAIDFPEATYRRDSCNHHRSLSPSRPRHSNPVHTSDGHKLFVGNIPYDYSESDVFHLFCRYGHVLGVDMPRVTRNTCRHPNDKNGGYAFVHFDNDESLKMAIDLMHGFSVSGRRLTVSRARG